MERRLSDMTIGELMQGLSRYRSAIATVAAILLIALLIPGDPAPDQTGDELTSSQAGRFAAGGTAVQNGQSVDGDLPAGQQATQVSAGGDEAPVAQAPPPQEAVGQLQEQGVDLGPFCDAELGRLMVPSVYSPPCLPTHGNSNNGATYQGVTEDEIVVAVYDAEDNPAAQAIVAAAGAEDSTEEVRATRQAYIDLFSHFYNTYGRTVKLVYVDGSGPTDDDEAAKADAIEVATEIKAFLSIGAPNNTYVDELVARGVMCICTASQPIESYLGWAPYAGYTSLMASTQGYVHRAEYIGKRLAGKNAVHAGDPLFQQTERTFALVYYETADLAYKSGADFFEQELKNTYGVELSDRIAYELDLAAAQEDARVIIARLNDKGITSVVFAGDFLFPIFLTKEATRQAYNPEWIITGSVLTDTTIFARTYDQAQWQHAFGVSFLSARVPQESGNAYRLHEWYFGTTPDADDSYGVIYPSPATLLLGIHMAGPDLTPQSFAQGMFNYPPSPVVGGTVGGGISNGLISYGQHGLWEWDDYLGLDDTTEIYWDQQATGRDEVGNDGIGMYRYVDGGKRYLPGQWPSSDPKVFDGEGVLIYDELPPQDAYPEYPCTGGCPSQE